MDLDYLKTGFARAASPGSKLRNHLADSSLIKFCRDRIAFAEGHGGGGNNRPATFGLVQRSLRLPTQPDASFAACVRQLHGGHATLLPREACDTRQRFDMRVIPDSQIPRTDSPFRCHARCFNNHQRGAPDRATPVMDKMPVRRHTVVC